MQEETFAFLAVQVVFLYVQNPDGDFAPTKTNLPRSLALRYGIQARHQGREKLRNSFFLFNPLSQEQIFP